MGRVKEEISPLVKAEMLSAAIGRPFAVVAPVNREVYGASGPAVWLLPETEEEVSSTMQVCSEEGWTVGITGAGTQWFTGAVGTTPDIILSLQRMNRVLEYSPSDMVVTVQAGTPLSVLQKTLREHRQMLPLDPVVQDEATVGGMIATAASGPRRALYGTVRDMVIGLRTVYPNGDVIRVGGKVVKNVAGYDMAKLFTGSYGTLAVLTEATFKLRPLPMHRETVLLTGDRSQIEELRKKIVDSYLIPSRLEVLLGDYSADVPGASVSNWTLAVDCDENEPSANHQTEQLRKWAHDLAMKSEVFRADEADEWWSLYKRPLLRAKAVIRVTAPPTRLTAMVESACRSLYKNDGCLISLGLLTGIGHIYVKDVDAVPLAKWIADAREAFVGVGGNLVVERAPAAVREHVDSFGSVGALQGLLRGIKTAIDPLHILTPGRFAGGL